MPRIVQNRGVARQRSEEEQKAVETILGALAHRFRRLQDEYEMKERRGEEPEGIAKGFALALREVNDLLPRRKRIKKTAV